MKILTSISLPNWFLLHSFQINEAVGKHSTKRGSTKECIFELRVVIPRQSTSYTCILHDYFLHWRLVMGRLLRLLVLHVWVDMCRVLLGLLSIVGIRWGERLRTRLLLIGVAYVSTSTTKLSLLWMYTCVSKRMIVNIR